MPEDGVKAGSGDAERIEVVVRHATNHSEMKVVLPASAKFKHVKTALARRLESDEVLERGQLINNDRGVYNAYKDNQRVGDVRLVLALCVSLEPPDGGPPEAELGEADLSDGGEEATKAAARAGAAAPTTSSGFDRARALGLQRELLRGFEAGDFQERLRALRAQREAEEYTEAQFLKKRQELFLTVQSAVLPSYGFEGSLIGVYKMMGAMGPFINDPEFAELAKKINVVIGIDSPQETWASLSKSCRKVEEEPRQAGRPKAKAPARGRVLPGVLGAGLGGMGGLGGGFGSLGALAPRTAPVSAGSGVEKPPPRAAGPGSNGTSAGSPARPGPGTAAAKGPSGAAPAAPAAAAPPPPAPALAPGPTEAEEGEAEAPLFEPWPAGRRPPFRLFVAGSWNDFRPTQMQWQESMFACPVTLGPEGRECFQLLLNGSWDRTFYPSMPDASALDEHTVCGPDSKGHDINWLIGKYAEEEARPSARFVIIAGLDAGGSLRLVSWQPV